MKKTFTVLWILLGLSNSVSAIAQVNVSGALSGNGSYSTLRDAFNAINLAPQTGASISITIDASTTETAMATLKANTWTSLVITSPSGPVTVTGPDTAVIKLEGADNVTIDGTPGTDNIFRDLSIVGTRTLTNSAGIWLAHGSSIADSNGAKHNRITNCIISCGVPTNTSGSNNSFGIYVGGATIGVTTQGRFNDSNQINKNYISRCTHGINIIGGGATRNGVNNSLYYNICGPTAFGPDQIRNMGIHIEFQTNCLVSSNLVRYVGGPFAQGLTGADRIGIGIGTNAWSGTPGTTTGGDYRVINNRVNHIIDQRTFSAVGIAISTTRSGSPTNNLCANNEIYEVKANSTSPDQSLAIGHNGNNSNDLVVYNSIYLVGDMDESGATSASQTCGGIRISTAADSGVTVRNNSIYVDMTSNTASLLKMCIQVPSSAYRFIGGVINNNDYFFDAANTEMRTGCFGTGTLATTFFTTLTNWQTAFTPAQDANSIQCDPQYCLCSDSITRSYGFPNYLIPASVTSCLKLNAAPIASVPKDILFEPRSEFTPTIGAFEYDTTTLPVELASLSASISNRDVTIMWTTASELNNSGFEIERRLVNSDWVRVGHIQGHGTVSTPQNYAFTDRGLATGEYNYRLKQIDFNGNFEYFNLSSEVGIGIPSKYELSQNYPNPFNPSTRINYDLPADGKVSLQLFDMRGRNVAVIVNEVQTAGYYSVDFNGDNLSSGVYFYTISSGRFVATKKMILLK